MVIGMVCIVWCSGDLLINVGCGFMLLGLIEVIVEVCGEGMCLGLCGNVQLMCVGNVYFDVGVGFVCDLGFGILVFMVFLLLFFGGLMISLL